MKKKYFNQALERKSLTHSWSARKTVFELDLWPPSTKWAVWGMPSSSSLATKIRANLSGQTSSPTPWTTQVLTGPSWSFLTSSTRVKGSSNVPFKNKRVSKKATDVASGNSFSDIWKFKGFVWILVSTCVRTY